MAGGKYRSYGAHAPANAGALIDELKQVTQNGTRERLRRVGDYMYVKDESGTRAELVNVPSNPGHAMESLPANTDLMSMYNNEHQLDSYKCVYANGYDKEISYPLEVHADATPPLNASNWKMVMPDKNNLTRSQPDLHSLTLQQKTSPGASMNGNFRKVCSNVCFKQEYTVRVCHKWTKGNFLFS